MADMTARARMIDADSSETLDFVKSTDHGGLMRSALELLIFTGARDVDLYDEAGNCYATLSFEFHDA